VITKTRTAAVLVAASLAAISLAGCASGGGAGGTSDDGVMDVWYRPGSLPSGAVSGAKAQFPDVKFNFVETADLDTKLAAAIRAKSGMPDIAVADILQYTSVESRFLDVDKHGFDDVAKDYVDWKVESGKGTDGRQLGIPIDVGPYALYYKPADFEAAGLPGDPDAVGEAISTWDGYQNVLEKLRAADKFGCDDPAYIYYFDVIAQGFSFYDGSGKDAKFDPESAVAKDAFMKAMDFQDAGLCSNVKTYTNDWNASVAQGSTVAFIQPPWVGGLALQQAAPDQSGQWKIANATPGGPAAENGSTLVVSASTPDPDLATKIAIWMTDADNQSAAYEKDGLFPSTVASYTSPELTAPQAYYGDQAVAEQLGKFATDAKVVHRGQNTMPAHQIFEQAIRDAQTNGNSADAAYKAALDQVKSDLGE
jgi:cellobiose transport system substrate-binding protein